MFCLIFNQNCVTVFDQFQPLISFSLLYATEKEKEAEGCKTEQMHDFAEMLASRSPIAK